MRKRRKSDRFNKLSTFKRCKSDAETCFSVSKHNNKLGTTERSSPASFRKIHRKPILFSFTDRWYHIAVVISLLYPCFFPPFWNFLITMDAIVKRFGFFFNIAGKRRTFCNIRVNGGGMGENYTVYLKF